MTVNRIFDFIFILFLVSIPLTIGVLLVQAQDSPSNEIEGEVGPRVPCTDPPAPSLSLRKEDLDNNR